MSVGQSLVLDEVGNVDKLKSLTEEIQSISNADYGAFDSLKIQEYANALSDLEPKQAALLLSTQGLSNAQIEQVLSAQKLTPELQYQAMLEAGLLSSKQKLTTAQIEETLQTVLGSDADVQATMSAMELKVATDAQGNSVAKLTKRNIEAAVASGKLTQEQALQLASMLGADMAIKKQTSSTLPKWIATLKLSAKAIWENITATLTWLATTPAGWATLATIAIVGTTVAIAKHTKSLKDLQETAQDSKSAYDSTISEIKSLNEELKTTQDRIKELQAKDSLTFTEEDELEKLKKTNDELERELRIKEAIAQTQGQKSANDANAAITKKSEKYNLSYSDNGTSFDTGDRIDATQWNIEQAIQNNKELEDLYSKRKEIEDKFNNDASQFKDDKEWKQNEKNIESKKAYIKTVEEQAATYIKALMDEDDALYDSNGNVIAGQEDLVNRLKALYGNYDEYNQGKTYSDTFVKHLQEKGISENVANEIKSQLTDNEIEKASTLDISPYIDENATTETVRKAIAKAQEEADKKPIKVTTVTPTEQLKTSIENKNSLDSIYSKYEKKNGDELNLELTDDEVASMLKEHPEYIEYLTKVGDTYKLNEHAMEQWTKANEEQNKSVQNMLGSYESMKNYSTLLNNIKAPSSHGIDEKGNIRSGLGDTKATKLESSDLDGLLDISSELNNSLAEGVINAKEYFDGISESITSSGLEQALKNVNLQFDETTDYIEEATAAISGELSDALLQSNKQFVLGQTTMSDYVGELKSGVSAEKKLIAATYNLEETEDERGELATQAMGATNDATQKAIDSYNQLNKAEQDLDAVSPLITSLSDNADFLANYVDSYGTLMDSIMDDAQFTNYVSSLSQALVDFANSSTENLYAVQDALVQNAYVSAAQAADLVSQGSDAIAENIGGSLDAVEGLTVFSMGEVGSSIQNASTSIGNVLSALGDALSSFDYSIKAEPYISGNFGIKKDENGLPCGIDIPSFGVNIHGEGGSSISNLSASLSSAGSYFSNSGKEQLKARAMDINSYRSKGNSSFTRPSVARPSTIETMNNSSGSSGSGSDSSSEPSPQDFNWVEPLLSKISKAYDRLKNKVADTTRTWLNRNNALSDSMETLLSEINAQSDAYDFYMDRFNSYDLDGYYKDQIANGSFNIETIYDDDLKEAISDCQDLYDKAQDAADSVQSLNIEIRQLAKSRFDNIQSQFEEVLGKVNSIKDLYSKDNDILEEQGWFASTLLNSSMIEQEQKNLEKLEQERDALTKALNSAMASGKIEAESEDWYSMQGSIDDVTSSIFDAKKALVEYNNAIRQIKWDAFDRTRDDVSNLIDETQFLVDLLKDEDITDDNGNMNDNGKAAQALIAQKYQLYLNQAKAYKDEILKIDEELANDPYDKELLDRKQELIKAQQEAINSSISEKEALKDLVKEGYDTFLDKLDEVIQKYKDLMSQQKDAYDYEKSIAEKTKALNALEKQYSAVQGDNSEEGKKNIQQLKDQINTAKDDLKDTEYEKLINDTEAILDNLADTTKTWLDERLDSFDITMQEIINQSNENASNISQTITSTAENYGYKLSESMSSIWSTNTNNITKVLGDFGTSFVDSNNKIKDVCGDINAAVQGLLKNSNDEAQRVADEIARQQAEQNANTDGGYSDGGGSSGGGDDWSDNWDNSDSGSSDDSGSDGVNWIYSPDDFPKDELDISSSIVDRIKWHDYDSSFGARAGYYEQMGYDDPYYGTSEQNIQMLEYMKSHGLKKGSKSAHGGLTLTDEDGLGSEVIFSKKYGTLRKLDAGDMVFNADQVEKLWNLSKGMPNMFVDNLGAKLPDIPNISNSLANKVDVSYGDVSLSFPNVHNYEDFMKQAQQDPKFEKMVQNMTLGQTLGRNSLSKLTFR